MRPFSVYLELAARIHVFLLLSAYGSGKIIGGQFYPKGKLPPEVGSQTLDAVKDFDLAWTFMGNSFAYILFIGLSQLVGAFMLLFDKTKLLGVAILIPILSNIIVFDMIYFDQYGALASACIYMILCLLILYLNKERVVAAFKALTQKTAIRLGGKEKTKKLFFSLLLFAGFFGLEQLLVNLLGH